MMAKKTNKLFIFHFIGFALLLIIGFPFTAIADSTLRVTWLANSEPDLGGYYFYYGTSSGNYGPPVHISPNVTSYNIDGLIEGTRYYIALSAHDLSNNESAKCPEINGIAPTNDCPWDSGHANYCLDCGPCPEGLGDCDGDSECENGLVCAQDVGANYGWDPGIDVCEAPGNAGNTTTISSTSLPGSSTTIPPSQTTTTTPSFTTTTTIGTTTVSLPPNSTLEPTGMISINNGEEVTASLTVVLHLSAFDYTGKPLTTNGMMSFSIDGFQWSEPEPFATEKMWILTPGEEIKTLYVLFGDAAGNWMIEPVMDQIIYENFQVACEQPEKLKASSMSASGEFLPFFAKENALDGDPSTLWSTPYRLFQREEYFTVDLGEIKNISLLGLHASRMFGTDFFPSNFKIQVSNDNISWVDMNTIQGYSAPLNTTSPDRWKYEGLECRYIKLSISKCRTFLFFLRVAQIAEIEVYGCDRGDQVPLIRGEKIPIRENEYPKNNASSEKTSGEQQVPGIPGKPVIKFVN